MKAIARLAKKVQPQLEVSIVQDEWRVYSVDEDVEKLEKGQGVNHFWQGKRYSLLSLLMELGLDIWLFRKSQIGSCSCTEC